MTITKTTAQVLILLLIIDAIVLGVIIFFIYYYQGPTLKLSNKGQTGTTTAAQLTAGYPLQESYSAVISTARASVVNIVAVNPLRLRMQALPSTSIYRFEDGSIDDSTKNIIVSGVVISPDGYILTNYHSLVGAEAVYVNVYGGSPNRFLAQMVSFSEFYDLAVIKIPVKNLPVARLGDSSKIETGDIVFAIGSPFGFEHSVSSGIISDDKRDVAIEGVVYADMIQTDAAINVGNSGGPLIDVQGRVIGINTAIWAPTGVFTGVGFAIPVNRAREVMSLNDL
ncbi:MAG: trypsin-like peptidase domain-containing protein [Deltaproteobacteria bacterium]|nr:trypsin-like peptidase domain-containing protein [Deltaproteobacteria bacterium]